MSLTFQQLVNAAPSGGTATIPPGSYGLVDVSKPVTIEGAAGVVVDAVGAAGKSAIRIHGAAALTLVQSVAVENASAQNFAGVMIDGQAASSDVSIVGVSAAGCCFGIRSYFSPGTYIHTFAAEHCAVGIGLQGVGGHLIDGFVMTDLDRMVVDDTTPGNDNGGNGFQLNGLQDGVHTVIRNGSITRARAQSDDYVMDGGGIELFGAADVLIQNVQVTDCVNVSETGTNPGKGDCARITFDGCTFTGRPGTDHTQDLTITCNGIIGRNLVDSLVEDCIFERLDWYCFDFTQSSKFSGSGTRNVKVSGCTFILRDGVDRVYSFGPTLPAGFSSTGNVIVANPTATLAVLNGQEYPATPTGFAAWKLVTGLEAGSTLYTPEQWAEHNNPTPPPPPPLPDPDHVIGPVTALILDKLLQPVAKFHDQRAAVNALCKAYRDAYARAQ